MSVELNVGDDLLLARMKNNSGDAFRMLYDRYSRKIFYFSLRYLNDHTEAEELVQSVFISIWEHRNYLDEKQSIKSYLYRSAVNYIYNYLKKKAVRERFIERELIKDEVQSYSTYDQLFFRDLERSINEIVEILPDQQKQIFKLSRFEGLSHEEIAGKMDLSVRTVENQIYRALKFIRNKLKDEIFFIFLFLFTVFYCALL